MKEPEDSRLVRPRIASNRALLMVMERHTHRRTYTLTHTHTQINFEAVVYALAGKPGTCCLCRKICVLGWEGPGLKLDPLWRGISLSARRNKAGNPTRPKTYYTLRRNTAGCFHCALQGSAYLPGGHDSVQRAPRINLLGDLACRCSTDTSNDTSFRLLLLRKRGGRLQKCELLLGWKGVYIEIRLLMKRPTFRTTPLRRQQRLASHILAHLSHTHTHTGTGARAGTHRRGTAPAGQHNIRNSRLGKGMPRQ